MKKQVYAVDLEGFIERVLLGDFDDEGKIINPIGDFVTVDLPQPLPFHKPKWDGSEWTEGATQEEIDEMTKVEPQEPTELDLLKEENKLLKAQVSANASVIDFHEEVLAEIIMTIVG